MAETLQYTQTHTLTHTHTHTHTRARANHTDTDTSTETSEPSSLFSFIFPELMAFVALWLTLSTTL